jgi:hypothetical protein
VKLLIFSQTDKDFEPPIDFDVENEQENNRNDAKDDQVHICQINLITIAQKSVVDVDIMIGKYI